MEHLVDAHYVSLPSQGNIYSLAPLALGGGAHKLLLATLRRRVLSFCYTYTKTQDSLRLKPVVREIPVSYIPSGCEIISIDAFSRSKSGEDYVIGITIIKQPGAEGGRPEMFLNTYMEQEKEVEGMTPTSPGINEKPVPATASSDGSSGSTTLDNATQNCTMLALNFVPYQLSHAVLPNASETVWLLGGGDCQMHVFREDVVQHCYEEVRVDELFPELAGLLPSPPLWSDVHSPQSDLRICAVACECGYVRVSQAHIRETECEVKATWEVQMQGPVSCVRFFTLRNEMYWQSEPSSPNQRTLPLNLLVVCTLQSSQIFMDVFKNGLIGGIELAGSASGDAVLCGVPADLDLDGNAEILLGTYGRQLLVYKWEVCNWELRATRTLPHPVHGLQYLDVTGDGARELLILTPRGLHVFQHHLEDVQNRVDAFLKKISSYLIQQNEKDNSTKPSDS